MFKTKHHDHTSRTAVDTVDRSADDELVRLLTARVDPGEGAESRTRTSGVVVGTLVGFAEDGAIPLVTYREQPGTAALAARATVDLYGVHVGRRVVLMFEEGDPRRPIVLGCLVDESRVALPHVPGQVDVEADGQHLLVSAKERIVLRCGKASITLTKEGKLILQGEDVSSRSSGVLRLTGGSIQIN